MLSKKILELLRSSPKSYFSTAEIGNYLGVNKPTLKVTLSRLVKQKRLRRLIRGYFSLPQKTPDAEQLAVEFNHPSYLSLEYALSIHGILSQVPSRLTLVTPKRSAAYDFGGTAIEYSHVKSSLFFGYTIIRQTQMARPEKALLDELYLIGLKKRKLDLKGLDLNHINKNLFRKWLRHYPPGTVALAKKLNLV